MRCDDHGGDDAFRVARAAAPDIVPVVPRWDKGWNRIHVRRERHHWRPEVHEDVLATRFRGHPLDLSRELFGHLRQVAKEEFADFAFIRRDRLYVDQFACEFEQMHWATSYFQRQLKRNARMGQAR